MSSSMLHRIILASILALSIPAWAGDLPDPTLTPGANNPDVTQSNIQQTICVKGYTKTIRPPVAYTNKLKKRQIRQYGYADRNPKHYEEDHLIALEIGGAPKSPDIPRKILGLKVVATGQEKEKSAFCNSKVLKRVCLESTRYLPGGGSSACAHPGGDFGLWLGFAKRGSFHS